MSFKESSIDPSLFILNQDEFIAFLFVYVDDIVIVGSIKAGVQKTISRLNKEFPLRVLGELKFFLGIQVSYLKDGIHLAQSQYLANLLKSCGMESTKPTGTPMIANFDIFPDEEPIKMQRNTDVLLVPFNTS